MKHYYSAGPRPLSPHHALHEAGLSFAVISAATKAHRLPDGTDFYSINPLGYVPLLEQEDGPRLREGPAITQYIADLVSAKKLAPAEAKAMAMERLKSRLGSVDGELTGKDYLMGGNFTVADAYLFTVTNWGSTSAST